MIFLTSTGFTNPIVYNLLLENTLRDINNACIITTGTTPLTPIREKHPIAIKSYNFLANQEISKIDYFDVEFDNPDKLYNYDLILILGGNSCHLHYQMYNSGTDKVLLDMIDKKYNIVGASAGAMLLSAGNQYTKYFRLGIEEEGDYYVSGLNITDDILFPHYDMFCERVPDLENQLLTIENKHKISITRLKNMDFIYIDNDNTLTKVME